MVVPYLVHSAPDSRLPHYRTPALPHLCENKKATPLDCSVLTVREMFGVTQPSGGRLRSQKTEPTEEERSVPSLPIQNRGYLSWYPLFRMVRETGLEPVWINHTPLKRARLPVPPLSRGRLPLYRKRTAWSRKISRFSQLFYEIPPAGGTDPLRSREVRVPISCGAGIMPRDGARAIERESWGERRDTERRSRCTQSSPITSRRCSGVRRSADL